MIYNKDKDNENNNNNELNNCNYWIKNKLEKKYYVMKKLYIKKQKLIKNNIIKKDTKIGYTIFFVTYLLTFM